MAHITSEKVKEVRNAVKKAFPNYKFSITGQNYSTITISLVKADFDVEKNYIQLNEYHLEKYGEKIQNIFEKVKEILFSIAPYHNNSDPMTDYFDYAYYYDFQIGKWNKPYMKK